MDTDGHQRELDLPTIDAGFALMWTLGGAYGTFGMKRGARKHGPLGCAELLD